VVLPGQYLERPAVIDAGDVRLEGLFHRGAVRPSLLVCPPPGQGGGMDAPLAAELAWAAARAGRASLRFQHRGVGASQGERAPERAVEDAACALRHLAESAPGPVAVAGVGGGCDTAAALARREPVAGLALLAPPWWPALDGLEAPILVVLPERGAALDEAGAQARLAPPAGRVVVVPGADPAFLVGLGRAAAAVAGWLARRG
jgi:hypothetical protein